MFAMIPVYSFLVPSSQSRFPRAKSACLFIGDGPCVEHPEVPKDLTPAECLVALLGRGQAIDAQQVLASEGVLTIEARRNHPCSHDQFCDAFLLPEGFEICYRRDSQDRRMLVHPDGRILLTSDFADIGRNRRRKMLAALRTPVPRPIVSDVGGDQDRTSLLASRPTLPVREGNWSDVCQPGDVHARWSEARRDIQSRSPEWELVAEWRHQGATSAIMRKR